MLSHSLSTLLLMVCTAALAVPAPRTDVIQTISEAARQDVVLIITADSSISMTVSTVSSITFSPLITIAPLSRNPLELRQKCFNDQGFSVNCATWTGYYYTWGGAGHPYAGGPGDSGSGSGSGSSNNNGITGIISEANKMQILMNTGSMAFIVTYILVAL